MKLNMTPKNKKMIAIGLIVLFVIILVMWLVKKGREVAAEQTVSGSTGKFSTPGTNLTQVSTSNEAAELQQRYAGMSKEAIIADYIEYRFNRDSGYLNFLNEKAAESNQSLDYVKRANAIYLLEQFHVPGF